ncbi:MAG: hypothetical protein E7560_00620 [Ruminococcaceae bacterium]|nr:hypothetical protein [Oscillospiraceae bacterium]
MRQNTKLTLSAIMAALSTAVMLLSYFPYLTYAIPAVAGLFIMVVLIEANWKWAFGAYAVSAVLTFLFAEPESKLMYICFFGYYPIAKALIERINKNIPEWILKLGIFNAAVVGAYFAFSSVLGVSLSDFEILGKYGAAVFLLAGNVVFVVYDIAVSRMATVYFNVLHLRLKKLLKL